MMRPKQRLSFMKLDRTQSHGSFVTKITEKKQLKSLIDNYEKMVPELSEAYKKDLGYGPFMTNFTAHGLTLGEMKTLLNGIDKWTKPKKVETPLAVGLGSSSIEYEPLGLALVLSAWNYPIYTAIPQVAAAISAGNGVILKPSELAPHTSNVLKKLLDKSLDKKYFRCIEGKVEIAKKLTSLPFDIICFTGSSLTGRLVAIQAAKNLTPCILQLGGKCPVIVDQTAKLDSAALRILFGKFLNCGQTCIGVDHVFIHESIKDKFRTILLQKIDEMYGKGQNLVGNQHYGKIINSMHCRRIQKLLKDDHGGKIIYGGDIDIDKHFVSPTIVEQPKRDSLLMKQEIFGPVLPILYYKELQEVITRINSQPKPLVVYMFSENKKNIEEVKNSTSSGSYVVNDSVVQALSMELPFGGVGKSGNGRWSGHAGFLSFSNPKSILKTKAINTYPLSVRFPPYTPHKETVFSGLMKVGNVTYGQIGRLFLWLMILGAVGSLAYNFGPRL